MFSLYKREINRFFSTFTGYLVLIVFLLINGFSMWIIHWEFIFEKVNIEELNILDKGYASIDTLFIISPWVFLFLIPAITMLMFAEEKKAGTFDLLLTRPLNDLQIILAKYFATLTLVVFALVPCLIYFLSVYLLGSPPGNIDTGGTWGSFIGLFFLAAAYISFGLFASSISKEMIIAFIVAAFISIFFFIGFEFISRIYIFNEISTLILALGINEHYKSMSRGLIDTRDVIYFLALISIFILITKTKLQSRHW